MGPAFRLRAFWGGFDLSYGTPEYSGATLVSAGASAVAGSGVGVRRCIVRTARVAPAGIADDADMHFDFMNLTGGAPDDTWTAADFTTLEGHLNTFLASANGVMSTSYTVHELRWYRVGTGIVPPNPAERVTSVNHVGLLSTTQLPPQVACSMTLRTARRKQWGRTYLPGLAVGAMASDGTLANASVDLLATAMQTLGDAAATDDFRWGVLSAIAGSFFVAERVEVDSTLDVIRRRRWQTTRRRTILP